METLAVIKVVEVIGIIVFVLATIGNFRGKVQRHKIYAKVVSCMCVDGVYHVELEYVDTSGETQIYKRTYNKELAVGTFVKIAYPGNDVSTKPTYLKNQIFIIIFFGCWFGFCFLIRAGYDQRFAHIPIMTYAFPLAIGTIFMLLGSYFIIDSRKQAKNGASQPIPATVVDYVDTIVVDTRGGETLQYHAVLEYTDENGLVCKIKSSSTYHNPESMPLGKKVTIYRNPKTGYVTDHKSENTMAFVGALTFAMGALAVTACLENLFPKG